MTEPTGRMRSERGDGGGTALEFAILAPVIVLLILAVVAFGRVAAAGSAVDAAAASAARAASQQADQDAATAAARQQAELSLREAGLDCAGVTVEVDASAFELPVGLPGSVAVSVQCTVSLSDVAMPGIPGSTTRSGHAASPIDVYRER